MRFSTCDFITDRSIASYQEIVQSIPVKDKLATLALTMMVPLKWQTQRFIQNSSYMADL